MSESLSMMRLELMSQKLDKRSVSTDPFIQFRTWYEQAKAAQIEQYDTMTLATSTIAGMPSARMVLLDGLDERGFIFFSSFDSRKGRELAENPRAALLFWWAPLYRQIRIEGTVAKLDPAECDDYFQKRPVEHQLESWASKQSQVIENRELLTCRLDEAKKSFADREITRPADFGGYYLTALTIDFWQARLDWLHDWIQYVRDDTGWRIHRLSP